MENALQKRGWLGLAKNQCPPETAAAKTIFSSSIFFTLTGTTAMMIPLGRDGRWRSIALRRTSARPTPLASRHTHRQQRLCAVLRAKGRFGEWPQNLHPTEKARQCIKCTHLPWNRPADPRKTIDRFGFYSNVLHFFSPMAEEVGQCLADHYYFDGRQITAEAIICQEGMAPNGLIREAPQSRLDGNALVVVAFAGGF